MMILFASVDLGHVFSHAQLLNNFITLFDAIFAARKYKQATISVQFGGDLSRDVAVVSNMFKTETTWQ